MAKEISFKFEIWCPLYGEQLLCKVGAIWLWYHVIYMRKIPTLLFLFIYSLHLRAQHFLGPHDTPPYVLICGVPHTVVLFYSTSHKIKLTFCYVFSYWSFD